MSKYPNIVLAMSGHDPCDFICMGQLKGDNGNVVTNMLIDGQYMDSKGYANLGGLGMVAMFYFSNEGKNVEVRWWSTVQNCYYRTENQFSFTINTVKASHTVATEKIAELPSASSITLNDVVLVNNVADYYNNLAPESKAKVTNVAKLNEALAKIQTLYSAKETAYSVTLKILSISDELNATTQKEIANLWTLYNGLDDTVKAEIQPYYIYLLEQKEARLGDNVMAAQRAQTLIEIIENSVDQKTATTLARQAFDALTKEQQSFISNLTELEDKLAYYENLVA